MTSLSDFSALSSLFEHPAGTWFELLDEDTKIGVKLKHPWMLLATYSSRGQFVHGCLRTTTEPKSMHRVITHPSHAHADSCLIDEPGWIIARVVRPIETAWLERGRTSCVEPDEAVVLEAQAKAALG